MSSFTTKKNCAKEKSGFQEKCTSLNSELQIVILKVPADI